MSLGTTLKAARLAKQLSLRDVERETGKEISNGYLSLLESDAVQQPSPKILHTLAKVLAVEYANLMRLAGYVPVPPQQRLRAARADVGGLALSADDLTSDEREKVASYIDLLRKARREDGAT